MTGPADAEMACRRPRAVQPIDDWLPAVATRDPLANPRIVMGVPH